MNNPAKSTLALAVAGSFLLLFAYQLNSRNSLQAIQLADYEKHVARLQQELSSHSDEQVAYETRINQLQRELAEQRTQLASLESALDFAQEQIDPDIARLEQEIRERVIVEVRAEAQRSGSRLDLVKQLSSLDPQEMGQIMTLQGQYGEFLQSLNVDDERLEEITDALLNQIAERNQRRREIVEARVSSGNAGADVMDFRRLMQEIDSPEAQREALSYVFTDEEMRLFENYQENRQNLGAFTSTAVISTADGNGGNAIFLGNDVSSGNGQPRTLQFITPSRPDVENQNN